MAGGIAPRVAAAARRPRAPVGRGDLPGSPSWYRYLNAGYRLPIVGGTDKMSSDTPVGIDRTYVRIPADEPFDHDAWCRNLRLGRTFHSGGPLLSLKVEGHDIGDTLELPAGGGTIEVEAAVESIFPVHTLQLLHDGEVIAAREAGGVGSRRLDLRERVRIERAGWLAVRTGGPGYWGPVRHHDSWQRQIFAHTSPVYVAVGEPYRRVDEEVAGSMLRLIDGALGYIRELSPQADPILTTHHHGEPDHMAYLARPYLEARAAVERRLRESGR